MISEKGKELIQNVDKQGLLELLSQDLGSLKLSDPEHRQIQSILRAYNQCLSEKKDK
jgi:hypothetical protein